MFAAIIAKKEAEIEQLRRDLGFVALWCYRSSEISDGMRLSVIKHHPSVKAAAVAEGLINTEVGVTT